MNSPAQNQGSAFGKPFLTLALVICLVIIALQFRATLRLREEGRLSRDQKREIDRLLAENKDMQRLRRDNRELELLRAENVELIDLRGKLAALQLLVSTQKIELDKLRGTSLVSTNKSTNLTDTAASPTTEEGYIAREDWIDAGFATPAATVETMFWATREGNLNRLVETMAPEDAREFTSVFRSDTDVELFWRVTRRSPVGRVPGYRITHVEQLSDDHVAVQLEGETNPLYLTQIEGMWKMGGKP
jgi:hypothetical protein